MLFEEVLSPMPCEGQYGNRPMTDIVERLRRGEACINDPCRMMDARSGCCCAEAADEIERLREALSDLIADWEAVPEDVQVPDEINVNEHWDAARTALKENT
jgi:hypothetical protein